MKNETDKKSEWKYNLSDEAILILRQIRNENMIKQQAGMRRELGYKHYSKEYVVYYALMMAQRWLKKKLLIKAKKEAKKKGVILIEND